MEYESIISSLQDSASAADSEAFRDCAQKGDQDRFAQLVSAAWSRSTGVVLPLCDACLESAVKDRSKTVSDAVARRDVALATAQTLQHSALSGRHVGLEHLLALSDALDKEEAALDARVQDARAVKRAAQRRLHRVRIFERRAARVEAGMWHDIAVLRQHLGANKDTMDSTAHREANLRWQLGRVRSLSVLSDAFFIWHRGPFVTLNSARLGRLPGQQVDWQEINAALGQFALVMNIVAQRVGFTFSKYRVVPMGSYARLAPVGAEDSTYGQSKGMDIFWSPGALLEGTLGFFSTGKLNASLKAFMSCLGELIAYAESADSAFRVPYAITGGGEKVGDMPSAVGKDILWTRAMKFAATDLKWLIAWAHKQPMPG